MLSVLIPISYPPSHNNVNHSRINPILYIGDRKMSGNNNRTLTRKQYGWLCVCSVLLTALLITIGFIAVSVIGADETYYVAFWNDIFWYITIPYIVSTILLSLRVYKQSSISYPLLTCKKRLWFTIRGALWTFVWFILIVVGYEVFALLVNSLS